MALSQVKSGSAWQSHFWQLEPWAAQDTKLFAGRKWIKVGFCLSSKLSTQLGGPLWESKKLICLRPRKWDCCSDLFCQNWRLTNRNAFASLTEWQDPGEHGCWLKVSGPDIVWVLLSQAFAAWRGWGADSAATLLAGCFFLRLRQFFFCLLMGCLFLGSPPSPPIDS